MKKILSLFLVITIVSAIVPINTFAQSAKKINFTDVKSSDYYAQAATTLNQLEILTGYPDGTFGADKNITRAEMAAIICRMLNKEIDTEVASLQSAFADVNINHWAISYINIASKEGIINGDGDGKFRPEDDILYEEAIKMVVCALGYGTNIKIDSKDWSKGYLDVASKKGISNKLKGSKGKAATRGDVAVMSYNGLDTGLENSKIPATPKVSVESGEYQGSKKVQLTTSTNNADIYYTLDGTTPTVQSNKYTKQLTIAKTCTLKAIAVKDGIVSRNVMSVEYTIKAAPSGGGGGGGSAVAPSKYILYCSSVDDTGTAPPFVMGSYVANSTVDITITPRENYVFVRWETNNGGTFANVNNSSTTFTMPAGNVTITAVLAPVIVKYTVSFDLNYDGATDVPESQIVNKGEVATAPATPTNGSYEFAGWFIDKDETDLSKAYTFSTPVESDILLYAKWLDSTSDNTENDQENNDDLADDNNKPENDDIIQDDSSSNEDSNQENNNDLADDNNKPENDDIIQDDSSSNENSNQENTEISTADKLIRIHEIKMLLYTADYDIRKLERDIEKYKNEISKTESEIASLTSTLSNVLKEKNVCMFIDGQWTWTYDSSVADPLRASIDEKNLKLQQYDDLLTEAESALAATHKIVQELHEEFMSLDITEYQSYLLADTNAAIKDADDTIDKLKADIEKLESDIAGLTASLNEVYAERNVKIFINGSWQWTHDESKAQPLRTSIATKESQLQTYRDSLTEKEKKLKELEEYKTALLDKSLTLQ